MAVRQAACAAVSVSSVGLLAHPSIAVFSALALRELGEGGCVDKTLKARNDRCRGGNDVDTLESSPSPPRQPLYSTASPPAPPPAPLRHQHRAWRQPGLRRQADVLVFTAARPEH